MKAFPFLDQRPEKENQFLLSLSQKIIIDSAVKEQVILDDDLAMIPEVMPLLVNLSSESRDDFYAYHRAINKALQFPTMNNCFRYCFAKGVESAYLWNQSKDGKVNFSYLRDEALKGLAGASVSEDLNMSISLGMELMYNVFCDFQDNVIVNPEYGFNQGDRWLADIIASSFFWSSMVGLDFGMNRLGFR